ncbi:MAG: bifunctional acetate--CoA ligase family protein/GNAT family N-acetyltransferase [Chloroflexi bacterium]|nr:bifunctional acetate--CoA ligase family protein/GNAT family N-acetyltransferase [Chloroflexota bacterium]
MPLALARTDVPPDKRHPLDPIFAPRSVAVIGASEEAGGAGRTVLLNLISSPFGGTVFPVNSERHSVLGVKAYPNIAAVPDPVDMAVVVTPASTVPGIMRECAEAGVRGAIVLSGGFKECGEVGAELERQVVEAAGRGRIRLIGPNCIGVMRPTIGLNAAFVSAMPRAGDVAFISQSGALGAAVLDWSLRENIGFSAFISIGSMAEVDWGDLIYYFGYDGRTHSILIHMETIGDARSFLSAAREVALTKPIIVMKAGRAEAAGRAAASHTGSLTGSDDVLDAAFRRCGVLRVNSLSDLFYMAEVLAKQPRPKGPRLAVVTNSGGAGVIATDALIAGGGALAELSPQTVEALNEILPPHWSRRNPIDILGDAEAERYAKVVEIAANDPNSDGLLTILTPQAMTDPARTAERLQPFAKIRGKPMLASWMGGAGVESGAAILNRADIPTFPYPDMAAHMFNTMWRYSYNLHSIYETPSLPADFDNGAPDRAQAREIVEGARRQGRTILAEADSKRILTAYGIPVTEARVAADEETAVRLAEEIGYPVVLKIHSETIAHKSDVGGVRLDLCDAQAVRGAYRAIVSAVRERVGDGESGVTVQPMIRGDGWELIVGSSIDPQFGPVLLFGLGGRNVEVFRDRVLALPPLNTTLARRMMEQTRVYQAMQADHGGKAVNVGALEDLMVRFSQLVVEQRWIKEIDVNPLLVSPEQLIALDARIILHAPEATEDQLPRLAIRPYPIQYSGTWEARDGTTVAIRALRPEDEPLMVAFHQTLSEETVYLRYFHMIGLSQRTSHERLIRVCFVDYDREMVLVADRKNPETGAHEILGVGRLTKLRAANEAEFAVLITDRFQGKGLGTELLSRLLQVGRDERLARISGEILPENYGMQSVCRRLGFRLQRPPENPTVVKAEIDLL